MKIALLSHGQHTDVQTFIGVALALVERGHTATLAAPAALSEMVLRCGVSPQPLPMDAAAFMASSRVRHWLGTGQHQAFAAALRTLVHTHREALQDNLLRSCEGADVLVTSNLLEPWALAIAEARGLPVLALHFNPERPNSRYANALVAPPRGVARRPGAWIDPRWLPWMGWTARVTHAAAQARLWAACASEVNHLRQRLFLPPLRGPFGLGAPPARQRLVTLHAFSPTLVAPPPQYQGHQPVVGEIRRPQALAHRLGETAHNATLSAWLHEGEPPVFVSLAGLPLDHLADFLALLQATCQAHQVRAVVATDRQTLRLRDQAGIDPTLLRTTNLFQPDWLLPRCRAAVHQGSSGMVHAALRAGLPSVVLSVLGHQPFWGAHLSRQAAGVHLPYHRLTPERLRRALGSVLDPRMRARAQTLGERMAAEPDAMPRVVQHIESLARLR